MLQLDAFATDQIDRILENVAEQADEEYQDLLRDAQAISASRSELTEIQGYLVHHHAELQKLCEQNRALVQEKQQRLEQELSAPNENLLRIFEHNGSIFDRAIAAIQQNPPQASFISLEQSVQKLPVA